MRVTGRAFFMILCTSVNLAQTVYYLANKNFGAGAVFAGLTLFCGFAAVINLFNGKE